MQGSFSLAALGVLLLLSGNATADILQAIPASAHYVVYAKQLDSLDAKAAQVAALVGQPNAPGALQTVKMLTGLQQGVHDKGSLAVAILPDENNLSLPIFFVPTNDYAALIKQLQPEDSQAEIVEVQIGPQKMLAARKGDYAVIGNTYSKPLIESVLTAKKTLGDQLAPLQKFLDQGDVCVAATPAGVQQGMRQALQGLAMVKQQMQGLGEQAKMAQAGLDMYESLFKATQKNVTHFALTARVEKDGSVHLDSRTLARPAAGFAKVAQTIKPLPFHPFQRLPGGSYVAAVGGTAEGDWTEQMMQWSTQVWQSMSNGQLKPEDIKKIAEVGNRLTRETKGVSFVMGVGEEEAPLYSKMSMLIHTENSPAYMKSYESGIREMIALSKSGSFPLYKNASVEKMLVDGADTLKFSMSPADVPGVDAEQLKEMYQKMFGGEQMATYLAAVDKKTVVGAYTSPESLSDAMMAAKSAKKDDLASDPMLAATMKHLPKDSHWVMVLSPQGIAHFTSRSAPAFGIVTDLLAKFPACPPLGMAAKITAEGVDTHMVAPAEMLKTIGKFAANAGG